MNGSKKFGAARALTHSFLVHPKVFIFFEKRTGSPRFQVRARPNGSLPVDQAISLLAVQCIARQKTPRDFGVMVAVDEDILGSLVGRTMKVIEGCSGGRPQTSLSRRQDQVLAGITEKLTNKEIAARLHISERTVKFHVSSLLQKFEVRGRVDLMLEATNILPHQAVHRRELKIPGLPAPIADRPAVISLKQKSRAFGVLAQSSAS